MEAKERERERVWRHDLIVRESELGGVFDRNQFAWYKRRATLAMSYCEGWNRDPGKMAGEWSRDYRGFSALIPRFFYTPGGRSIPPLADFWIRHAIPAAWNLYLISFFFLFFPLFLPFFLLFRVAIEFVLNYDLAFSSSSEDEIIIMSVMKIDNFQCVSSVRINFA